MVDFKAEIRQNIDPYPLGTQVKLIWDRLERVGVILFPDEDELLPGDCISVKVGILDAPVVMSSTGEKLQPVFWEGEDSLGFWSPEYLLPSDFPFNKRPSFTIARNSMYYIDYTNEGLVKREGFMYVDESEDSHHDRIDVYPL